MSLVSERAGFAVTRRGVLAGAAATAACLPFARARAGVEGTVIVGTNGWLFPTWEKLKDSQTSTINQVTPIISGVVNQFKAAGIDVAITLIPMRARIYPQFLPPDSPVATSALARYAFGRGQLVSQGVLVPDLATFMTQLSTQPAAAAAAPDGGDDTFVSVGSDLFFKADSHWATPGSLPVAQEVGRQIMAGFQLPAAPAPGVQLGDPTKTLQEANDLAELLPAAEHSKYPFESYMLPETATSDSSDSLIASDAADAVVIGNSYMQPKYGFPAQLSATLNRPVSLYWKIDRFGPFATLVEYLGSDLFKQQRPKLIVWNIRESQLEHLPSDDDFYAQNAMAPAALTAAVKAALG